MGSKNNEPVNSPLCYTIYAGGKSLANREVRFNYSHLLIIQNPTKTRLLLIEVGYRKTAVFAESPRRDFYARRGLSPFVFV